MTMSFESVPATPARTRSVLLGTAVWFAVALILSISGAPQKLTPPAPQIVILLLTIALIAFGRLYSPLRAWIVTVDIRALAGLHVTRALAGTAFLWAASRGTLSPGFANAAGYGDILVAILALLLIVLISPEQKVAPLLYVIWNTLGLIDIMYVVVTAARIALADPPAMAQLLRAPFALIPLFLVPIVIASHVWIFERLLRRVGVGI
jgi:hypothetical protein